ncbi:CAP domain-containing protein [Sporosarcina sp. CAU 1771]
MKVIFRIIALLIVVLLVFYYTDNRIKENEVLESPVRHGDALPIPNKGVGAPIPETERPEKGLSTLVGGQVDELLKSYGEPERVEPSAYGYDWWIYLGEINIMAGVTEDNLVNQIYSSDFESDLFPYTIGQSLSEIYRFTIVNNEIDVEIDENLFTFTLNGEDVQNRLLITNHNLYTQLYIDKVTGELHAVRFIDPVTLVLHQPYDMTYTGEMLVKSIPSSSMQLKVDRAAEHQIYDLTNSYRKKNGMFELTRDYRLSEIAREHSKEGLIESYSSMQGEESSNLSDRLKDALIDQQRAGENIALNYVDPIEAVNGWINSPAHRNVLLNKHFTHIGVGVYGKYYTQNLVQLNYKERNQQ